MVRSIIIINSLLAQMVMGQSIEVPLDYNDPNSGSFQLEYEFGAEFNPELPTVVVIADAQQFYVRKGRMKKIQDDLFSKRINVLGILPRSTNEELRRKVQLQSNGTVDWFLAYKVYRSFQYANDIHSVLGKIPGDVYLYGQSGGALLITEYLSLFPDTRVKKVFIGASVNPVIEQKLGIIHDDFQRAFLSNHPQDRKKLDAVMDEGHFDRKLLATLFQRQNFFVGPSELSSKRSELIHRLYHRDTAYVAQLQKEFQIDAINALFGSEDGIPIRVRLSEFIYPLMEYRESDPNRFYPDLENSYQIAEPIMEHFKDQDHGMVNEFNERTFRKFTGKLFLLAGRYDHVADYRSSIYLGSLLENASLFIADDDHTFKSLKAEGHYSKMIQDFFFYNTEDWISTYSGFRWKEK
ncbi:hypothetical protein [Flagellimonas amoyensis]|uniref:hypothetical protein n=1 Tax=Flagellimonas amoyensis TaxID=2169401 RepID=UPI000D344A34|nr:hypothetical protein [Allomuricauda amoyensis]